MWSLPSWNLESAGESNIKKNQLHYYQNKDLNERDFQAAIRTFKKREEGWFSQRSAELGAKGESIPGRGNSTCKSPKVGKCLS